MVEDSHLPGHYVGETGAFVPTGKSSAMNCTWTHLVCLLPIFVSSFSLLRITYKEECLIYNFA